MKYIVKNISNGLTFEATQEQVDAMKEGIFARKFTYTPIKAVQTPPEAKPRKKKKEE